MKLFQDFYSRNTQHPQVIKQIVTQPKSLLGEVFKLTLVIAIVILLSKGISYASNTPLIQDILSRTDISKDEVHTLNTLGYTTDITPTSFTIHNAKNPQGQTGFSYTVDIQDALIKSYTGEELSAQDLKPNQQVIAKGLLSNQTIIAHTIIIFGDAPSELMATSTPEIATTTDTTATSTATTTDTATSTDSFVDTVTDAVDTIFDTVSDTLSNIINTLTGTSTEPIQDISTSTEESAQTDIPTEEPTEPTLAEPLSSDTTPIEEPQSIEEAPEESTPEPTEPQQEEAPAESPNIQSQ